MVREIRCPESATCNKCRSAKGKLLFKVHTQSQKPADLTIEIMCPQLRGKLIRVKV